jgi:hypothetical protein
MQNLEDGICGLRKLGLLSAGMYLCTPVVMQYPLIGSSTELEALGCSKRLQYATH